MLVFEVINLNDNFSVQLNMMRHNPLGRFLRKRMSRNEWELGALSLMAQNHLFLNGTQTLPPRVVMITSTCFMTEPFGLHGLYVKCAALEM